jgi:threonyl-tRNA synthetase
MQAKIRSSELAGIPIILVIGEKEEQNQAVSVRLRDQKEVGLVSEEQLVSTIKDLNLS